MVDYSKWDHIDISDDEGEDCHPNIDKQSWIKWKKEARQIKRQEDREAREKEDKQFQDDVKNLDLLTKKQQQQLTSEEGKSAEQMQKRIEEYKKRRENEAKHPVWDESTILKEGFSKTIINKPKPVTIASLTAEKEKEPKDEEHDEKEPQKAEAEGSEAEASEEGTAEQEVVDDYVKQMEIKAHTFASSKTFEEYFDVLKKYPEIMCSESHQYLLLHSSDFMKKGEDALSQHYLKAACIVNYCLELGKDGVSLFFHRMRESNPKWRVEFEKDTLAYWYRIREKYIELGKIKVDPAVEKAKAEARAKPAKIEDDLD